MKAAYALAFAAVAVAAPGGWQDADPAKKTETTTWSDYDVSKPTGKPKDPKETTTWADYWGDEEVSKTTTKSKDPKETETWKDYEVTKTKKPEDPKETEWAEWEDQPATKYTTKTVTVITTYVPKPTTFVDKWETYTVTKATTLTLTKGPYTITVPIYEETKTECEEGKKTPAPEKPAGEKPAGEKPAGEKPAGEKPAGEKPAGEYPAGEKPAGEKPAGEYPAGGADKPVYPTAPAGGAEKPAAPTGGYPSKPTDVATYTGSASKIAGAGLAGVAALAALLL